MKKGSTSCTLNNSKVSSSLALQDLMLQFELEAKLSDDFSGRMSLDGGRDAMNRSSFGNNIQLQGRRSVCCDRRRLKGQENNNDLGESVVWCKPGVVARLMGLEAIPLPLSSIRRSHNREKILAVFRMQNPRIRFCANDASQITSHKAS